MKSTKEPTVGIIMGSKSDCDVMKNSCDIFKLFKIKFDVRVISAHRTPQRLERFISDAEKKDYEVIIAAAGGAAHLAGVTAALTTIPVLGVPMPSVTDGIDSLLSTVQMPAGVPVATFAAGKAGATNAGIFAAQMIATTDESLAKKINSFKADLREKTILKDKNLDRS